MEILQVAQHADDLQRARAFYQRLLNAEPTGFFDPPGLLFFQAGAVRLLLEQVATSVLIYLKVDDVRATVESLRTDGVEIVAEPMLMKSYGVSLEQLIAITQQSNSLVAAGALEGATGRFAVKVPALFGPSADENSFK